MPRREKELLARDAKRNIGDELLQAIRDVKAGRHGAKYKAAGSRPVQRRPC
jgi:putative transcriptional regulator